MTIGARRARSERKARARGEGEKGRDAAALDAAGAALGSAGLAAFGAVMWLLAIYTAAGSLALATAIWFAVSVLLWLVRRDLRVYRT